MTPTFDKVHNHFQLNGFHYNREGLKEVAYSYIKEGDDFEIAIGEFLADWLDPNDTLEAKTSGSTGAPKTIGISKQAMVHSALTTGDFFELQPKDGALLCLPAGTIAGKMMLIRAMMLGLHLDIISPKKILEINERKVYRFAAMIPMQLQMNLSKVEKIEMIIVGGAPVSSDLKKTIQNITPTVFESYGMTETVSHIALKQLNNFPEASANNFFVVLPGVLISQDERGCLVIDAKNIAEEIITTNDVVKIHGDSTFEWLGRTDFVINSGGVKIHPEMVENALATNIDSRFFIASLPDNELGERVILIIEGETKTFKPEVFSNLNKHEIPKEIFFVKRFKETDSGKIQRKKTVASIK
ncbi:O-succinylbenzoic acid--CoA ligase [Bizionia argentinensis JUB59]|uniref:O-succinylbenzoic acid--CoA ligase n=1 Tax=Bizionia argentinensis JUB59 TaxID=1046627 RepID=G2E9V2_9FLAO|nr:AMP-binding protein [Bizionia argentinensis]EGV45009.1 O-succinylbenzoic acid--CoA ligase [Bizionia argentinensis JUB59]